MSECSESSLKAERAATARLACVGGGRQAGRPPCQADEIQLSGGRETPPPGFRSSTVYHMALSSWAPLSDNERRQAAQLQAEHSAFYRPKHVSGKLPACVCALCRSNTAVTITFSRPLTLPCRPAHRIEPP